MRRQLLTDIVNSWRKNGVVRVSSKYQNKRNRWISELDQRRGKNIAAVEAANKNARIAWVLLSKEENYNTAAAY